MNTQLQRKLLFLPVLLLLTSVAFAQFTILNANGDIGSTPEADDINVCFIQGGELSFRAIALAASTNPLLSINLSTGREYVDGSIMIVNQSGGFSLGPNIGTLTNPQFAVSGSFTSGDFIEVSMRRVGNCTAINQNGLMDEVILDGSSEISTTHDALFLTLSIGGLIAPTVAVGDMTTLVGEIIGGGNGCVEDLVFALQEDAGLTTTALRVQGNTLTPDSTVAGIVYYSIGQAEISSTGDNDNCLEALESLSFERDVTVTSCEVASNYEARWGCNGEVCISTGTIPQQVNIAPGVPNMTTNSFAILESSNACETAVIEVVLMNNGTESLNGAGTAFDVIGKFGMDGGEGPVVRGGQRLLNASISNGAGAFTSITSTGGEGGTVFQIDMSQFGTDPDGPGGLDDLDGDGQFDDLPVGETVTLRYEWMYICFGPDCGVNRSGAISSKYCFNDQCDNSFESNRQGGAGFGNRYWNGTTIGPTDVSDQQPDFELEFCYSGYLGPFGPGGLMSCPDAQVVHNLVVPPGFNLTGSVFDIVGVTAGESITSSGQTGNTIEVITDLGTTSNIVAQVFCLTISLQLDCNEFTGIEDFSFNSYFECDPGNCSCQDGLYCQDFDINVHCPKGPGDPLPGGFTINSSDFERITTGFVDAYSNDHVDLATLTDKQLNNAMPCDTVIGTYTGTHTIEGTGVWFENAHFWIGYNLLGNNTLLRPVGAQVEIYDNSSPGSLIQNCTLGLPDGNITTGGRHNMFWDISADCGHTFGPNDSMSMQVIWVIDKNSTLTGSPTQIADLRTQFFSLNAVGDTVNCDLYAGEILLHEPTYSRYDGTGPIVKNGCGPSGYFSTYNFVFGPTDPYPNEVRPYGCIDSFAIELNNGDVLDPDGIVRLIARGLDDIPGGNQSIDITALAEPNADGTRIVFRNDGSWPRADLGNQNDSYTITFSVSNSCGSAPSGQIRLNYYIDNYCYSKDGTCQEPLLSSLGRAKINILPTHEIADLSGLQLITKDTVCWTVQVNNTTNVVSGYIFLALDEMSSAGIDIIQAQDITPDTSLVLVDYANGQWIRVAEDFGPAATKDIKLTAVVTDCAADSIKVLLGYDCVKYPDNPLTYPCDLDSVYLNVEPLNSQVQIELNQEAAPYDLCAVINDTVRITSALDAYLTDLLLCIPLLPGLEESDLIAEIEYPVNSGNIQAVPIAISPGTTADTAYVDIMQHPAIAAQGGIPGTQDATTAEEAQVEVFLDWVTDCDFRPGDRYRPYIFANRPCGDPALDNGTSTLSDPISINGATPPYVSAFESALSVDTIKGCDSQSVMFSQMIIVGTSTDSDSIFITLPEGVTYTDNSYVCNLVAPDDVNCPLFVEVRTINSQEQVVLKIPPGISGMANLDFGFSFEAQPDGLCDEDGEFIIEAISSANGVFCPTTGMTCPALNTITGSARDTLNFQKAKISFDSIGVCDDNGTYTLGGEVSIADVDIPANDFLLLDVFCSSNLGAPVTMVNIPGPITAGTSVTFESEFAGNCAPGDSLFVSLSPASGNCVCAPVDTFVQIRAISVVEAGGDITNCGSRPVDLSSLGASITGFVTTGTWSSSGDGVFAPDTAFGSALTYTPGPMDVQNGEVILTLTSDTSVDSPCPSVSDQIRITITSVGCGTFPWDGN